MLEMPSIESDFSVLGGVDFNLLFCYEIPRGGFVAERKTKRLRMAPIAFQSILSFQVGVDDSSKEDKMRQRPSQCPLGANLLLRIPMGVNA
jgi:hypothetical protein